MFFVTERNLMMRRSMFGMAACAALVFQTAALAQGQLAQGQADGAADRVNQLLVQAQKICPVSGEDLTSMGGPIEAKIDKQTVFLCCRGCMGRPVQKQHWDQIQSNQKKAQGKCPVMDKPLPEKTLSTVVKGRRVFVCCPPCTKKIQANPEKYLAEVNKLLEENLSPKSSLQ